MTTIISLTRRYFARDNADTVILSTEPLSGQPGGLSVGEGSRRQGGDGPAQPDTAQPESKDP